MRFEMCVSGTAIRSHSGDDWAALPEPDEAISELEPFDDELPTIMQLVLGDNPAMKSKGLDRLETHLEACDKLPLRQVYGLLLESCESSKLSRLQSYRFQWMLLRYVAKHGVPLLEVLGIHSADLLKRSAEWM